MIIMEGRRTTLESALAGYNATDVPLISYYDGFYSAAGFADDLGIYYFIPSIAKFLGIPISSAINVFFGGLLLIGTILSLLCFFSLFKHRAARLISVAGITLLTYAAYRYSDVYIAGYFAVATIVPLSILFNEKMNKLENFAPLFFALSGIISGYSNLIRSHAGTGALIFLVTWLLLQKYIPSKRKFYLIVALLLFFAIPYMHFQFLEKNRDHFLTQQYPSYVTQSVIHPKWHNIYIGFGYLANPYGITYSDTTSHDKVVSVNPHVRYCSSEYEEILKNECFQLAKKDPWFVSKTIIIKILKLLYEVLRFANLGLLLAFLYVRPRFRLVFPFLLAGLFYALPGILTMPTNAYVSGMITMATIFGIYMICLYCTRPETWIVSRAKTR